MKPLTERQSKLWGMILPHLPDGDLAHDRDHVCRVYAWSVRLAPEAEVDVDLAGACAMVHDLVNIPKDHPDRPLGGERSAEAAPGFLFEAGYRQGEVDAIVEAVRTSSWSRGLKARSALGRVLQDADRLDAIGAVGIARCMSCAQAMGDEKSRYYHPDDPLFDDGRPLDDRRFAVDHFAAKLLKLADGMHYEASRKEAQRRHQTMLDWLQALKRELKSCQETE